MEQVPADPYRVRQRVSRGRDSLRGLRRVALLDQLEETFRHPLGIERREVERAIEPPPLTAEQRDDLEPVAAELGVGLRRRLCQVVRDVLEQRERLLLEEIRAELEVLLEDLHQRV